MPVNLLGIGTALSSHRLSKAESAAKAQSLSATNDVQATLLRRLQRRSGVAFRHSVLLADADGTLPDRLPPGPAGQQRCLGCRRRRSSCDHPPGDGVLQRLPGPRLRPGADPGAAVGRRCGPNPGRYQRQGAALRPRTLQPAPTAGMAPGAGGGQCAVCRLADGAAATVLAADGPSAAGAESGAGAGVRPGPVARPWRLLASGSTVLPNSADAMAWTIGDHGFEMGLSPRVPALIAARLAPWLAGWLAARGLDRAAIGSWALHPGGPRLLESVRDCLGLPASAIEPSIAVLRECGNMSSATILFILDRLRLAGAPLPCVALVFGPGLCVEAALLG